MSTDEWAEHDAAERDAVMADVRSEGEAELAAETEEQTIPPHRQRLRDALRELDRTERDAARLVERIRAGAARLRETGTSAADEWGTEWSAKKLDAAVAAERYADQLEADLADTGTTTVSAERYAEAEKVAKAAEVGGILVDGSLLAESAAERAWNAEEADAIRRHQAAEESAIGGSGVFKHVAETINGIKQVPFWRLATDDAAGTDDQAEAGAEVADAAEREKDFSEYPPEVRLGVLEHETQSLLNRADLVERIYEYTTDDIKAASAAGKTVDAYLADLQGDDTGDEDYDEDDWEIERLRNGGECARDRRGEAEALNRVDRLAEQADDADGL